ncbi:unnamed protein product [Macrosiphum euphorbiae]|uniref:TTF-type domain-containing protein n=1 Tax=Macrosiphum euphorbiae TaxID=13131 RepID=A0AAV0WSR4_9HEMI|nr:unnamed protein product [Macrosiphum euphorbiae]
MASSTQNSHSDYQPPVIDININVNVAKLNNDGADLGDLLTGPSRPVLKSYPKTKYKHQNRSFNAAYYNSFVWLEYSIANDALFCFACRNFATSSNKNNEDIFTKAGFKHWKKLSGSRGANKGSKSKLELHEATIHHITCMEKWMAHKETEKTGTVLTQISSQHKLLIESNRMYIRTLSEVTLFLCRQGLAFRGHDESIDSLNQGNFKETCNLLAKFYPEFAQKYKEKTNHTSHGIQNELISICANILRETIIKEVNDVGIFGIMCDEARCFKEEQMALCIRYCKGLDIKERFLGFIDCSMKQDSESLSQLMLEYLKQCKLSPQVAIVAQFYDGASVMSGRFNGVQAKIKSKYPFAIYTHCMAHRINLVVLDMCKIVKDTRCVFDTLEALYIHFSNPTNNLAAYFDE